jgi:protein JSN1
MERLDAVRARDDILNRLGGHVAALSKTAPVRIGFGKIDAVPTVPLNTEPTVPNFSGPMYNPAPPPAMTVRPQPAGLVASPDIGGDQSMSPTRALWIGSIPGSTTAATLLQIFSPFGPVESARVLMAKVSSGRLCVFRLTWRSAADSSTLNASIVRSPHETL